LLSACQKPAGEGPVPPPLVRTLTLSSSAGAALELRGSVAAAHRVLLGFKQGGLIAALSVEPGQRVVRGQILGRLDPTDTLATVQAAQAACDKARRDLERAERLVQIGAIAVKMRDDARTELEAADADLIRARDALARTQLRAPENGTVFARLAEPGETVGPGTPVLVIDSTWQLVIRAGATEQELAQLKTGQSVVLLLADNPSAGGCITSLAATPNPEDGLYTVEVTPAAAPPLTLLPGALVRLQFAHNPTTRAAIRIPLDALVHRRDQDFVFVLQTPASGPVVRLRPIMVAHVSGTEVVVQEGLSSTERIVAEGAYFLQDNQAVRVLE
jgi:RND family efflux transporter MFP subunit